MPVRSAAGPGPKRSPPCVRRCSACCANTALTTSPPPYVTSPGPPVLRSVFSACILHNEKTLVPTEGRFDKARSRGLRCAAFGHEADRVVGPPGGEKGNQQRQGRTTFQPGKQG